LPGGLLVSALVRPNQLGPRQDVGLAIVHRCCLDHRRRPRPRCAAISHRTPRRRALAALDSPGECGPPSFWRPRSRAAHRLPGTATVGLPRYEYPSLNSSLWNPRLWEAGCRRHAGTGRGPREGAPALSGACLVDRAEAGESGCDLHLPTSGCCL